jgi:hypothetical protein
MLTGSEIVAVSQLTAVILGMCLVALVLIIVAALFRVPEATIQLLSTAVQSGLIIRMTTAIVIVIAVFGLRLSNLVSAEATIATLSGIAAIFLVDKWLGLPPHNTNPNPAYQPRHRWRSRR